MKLLLTYNFMYTISATPLFKTSLQRLKHFLTIKFSVDKATATIKLIKSKITSNLITQPCIAPISPRLLELGITHYRQYVIDEHNIVFYQINEKNKTVLLLAVMDSRQDIQKLLYELTILAQVD